MKEQVYDELNDANLSIPERYTPLEYLNELWERGLEEYLVPRGESSFEFLETQSIKGLTRKYVGLTDEIKERWKYELDKIWTGIRMYGPYRYMLCSGLRNICIMKWVGA